MSRCTHFFCKFFVTEKQTTKTFSLLECMPPPSFPGWKSFTKKSSIMSIFKQIFTCFKCFSILSPFNFTHIILFLVSTEQSNIGSGSLRENLHIYGHCPQGAGGPPQYFSVIFRWFLTVFANCFAVSSKTPQFSPNWDLHQLILLPRPRDAEANSAHGGDSYFCIFLWGRVTEGETQEFLLKTEERSWGIQKDWEKQGQTDWNIEQTN